MTRSYKRHCLFVRQEDEFAILTILIALEPSSKLPRPKTLLEGRSESIQDHHISGILLRLSSKKKMIGQFL